MINVIKMLWTKFCAICTLLCIILLAYFSLRGVSQALVNYWWIDAIAAFSAVYVFLIYDNDK